jgi:ketosteroid isomerase-like protein
VVWKASGHNPLSGDYRGPDGVLDYLAKVGERADDFSTALVRTFVSDEGAVLIHHAVGARGAKRLEQDVVIMLLVRDGRINLIQSVPTDQAANDRFWT